MFSYAFMLVSHLYRGRFFYLECRNRQIGGTHKELIQCWVKLPFKSITTLKTKKLAWIFFCLHFPKLLETFKRFWGGGGCPSTNPTNKYNPLPKKSWLKNLASRDQVLCESFKPRLIHPITILPVT